MFLEVGAAVMGIGRGCGGSTEEQQCMAGG